MKKVLQVFHGSSFLECLSILYTYSRLSFACISKKPHENTTTETKTKNKNKTSVRQQCNREFCYLKVIWLEKLFFVTVHISKACCLTGPNIYLYYMPDDRNVWGKYYQVDGGYK